jgi:hypothetical protein
MGFIKVRIQHHWVVKSSSIAHPAIPESDLDHPPVLGAPHDGNLEVAQGLTTVADATRHLTDLAEAARPTEPCSVKEFVDVANGYIAQAAEARDIRANLLASAGRQLSPTVAAEAAELVAAVGKCCRPLLDRIQMIVLESHVPDVTRISLFRTNFQLGPVKSHATDPDAYNPRLAATFINPLLHHSIPPIHVVHPLRLRHRGASAPMPTMGGDASALLVNTSSHSTIMSRMTRGDEKSRRYATHARRSLLAMLACKDQGVQLLAADIVLEALDRNWVAMDAEEFQQLVAMVQDLRATFPSRSALLELQKRPSHHVELHVDLFEKVVNVRWLLVVVLYEMRSYGMLNPHNKHPHTGISSHN